MEMVALLLLLSCHVVLPLLTQRFGYLIWSDLMLDLLLLTLAASDATHSVLVHPDQKRKIWPL